MGPGAAPMGLAAAVPKFADKASDPRYRPVDSKKEYKPYPELRPIGKNWLTAIAFAAGTDSSRARVGDTGHWAIPYYRSMWLRYEECANTNEWDAALALGGPDMFARDVASPRPANQRRVRTLPHPLLLPTPNTASELTPMAQFICNVCSLAQYSDLLEDGNKLATWYYERPPTRLPDGTWQESAWVSSKDDHARHEKRTGASVLRALPRCP